MGQENEHVAAASMAKIEAQVLELTPTIEAIRTQVAKRVVGQQGMIDGLLIGLLTGGHVLLEGVPGLAKTLVVRTLAETLKLDFGRVQFTPDLLPADLTGTQIYNAQTAAFTVHKGPIFANILLADEINRSPAKVQSALLEAMAEDQVTIGDQTFPLPSPFLVLATQNPLEQEGTYALAEAQADRFMMKVRVAYPSRDEERRILDLVPGNDATIEAVADANVLARSREIVAGVHVESVVLDYIVDLVQATRDPAGAGLDVGRFVEVGASPRATLAIAAGARAHAVLQGRAFVTPDDVKAVAAPCLRHRVLLTYEAEAEGQDVDSVIASILHHLPTP
jgi:MoxR-like ATPase